MALLIDIAMPQWMTDEAFRAEIAAELPDVDIRCIAEPGELSDVIMLACVRLRPGLAPRLPNLELVQKLGAGVETVVGAADLGPPVRIARLKPGQVAQEMTEYCLAYALRHHHNIAFHEAAQRSAIWKPIAPRETQATTVGVLGLGQIGGRVAAAFVALGFRVVGWSRSAKSLPDIDCRYGAALEEVLAECDYIASVLPSTSATRDLADARFFAAMKPGAVLINVGRGDLVVEGDLLAALDSGHLGGAVLDVFRTEPLPADHPFWSHPKVTVTPHISGWRQTGAAAAVAENYRRLKGRQPLLDEVDRATEY